MTLKNLILFTFLFLQYAVLGESKVIYSSEKPFTPFLEQAFKQTVLLILEEEGLAKIWDFKAGAFNATSFTVDKRCTSSLLLYAHPVLLDAETTCYIDDLRNEIIFLGKTLPPQGHFSFIYFFQDQEKISFLFNGRDFPHAKHGYIKAKVVYKDGREHFLQDLVTQVPGYSGAMFNEEGISVISYTKASGLGSNEIYSLPKNKLRNLFLENQLAPFSALAGKTHGLFPGLAMKLFSSNENYLYYNKSIYGEYPSYTLHKKTKVRESVNIPQECDLLGQYNNRWYFHCRQKELVYSSEWP